MNYKFGSTNELTHWNPIFIDQYFAAHKIRPYFTPMGGGDACLFRAKSVNSIETAKKNLILKIHKPHYACLARRHKGSIRLRSSGETVYHCPTSAAKCHLGRPQGTRIGRPLHATRAPLSNGRQVGKLDDCIN